jgi:hypothetical protein
MRSALSGFVNGSLKRAMTAWIANTFEAFHLAAGFDGHTKYRIRKAIRIWVERSRVRKGLRRQVWVCAQKGGSELMALRQMMPNAETEDLANALIAQQPDGSTPLLCASRAANARHRHADRLDAGRSRRTATHRAVPRRAAPRCALTPLTAPALCARRLAAKKGFADVAELFIGTASGISSEHPTVLTADDLAGMVNAPDKDGSTALHWAARKGHEAVAVQLIESGAAVDAVNKEESTALHWAARKHNGALLQILLAAGAAPHLQNKWGATALDNAIAIRRESPAVERLRQAEKQNAKQRALFSAAQGVGAAQPGAEPGMGDAGRGWGEGPGVGDGAPRGQRAIAEQKRRAANERREAALKARQAQEDEKATQMRLRRQRNAVEMKLKQLLESLEPGATPLRDRQRDQSPPKSGSPIKPGACFERPPLCGARACILSSYAGWPLMTGVTTMLHRCNKTVARSAGRSASIGGMQRSARGAGDQMHAPRVDGHPPPSQACNLSLN